MVFRAIRSVQAMIEANRPFAKPRYEVIARTPALHERGTAKAGVLADAVAAALRAQGVTERRAFLAARTGMAAFAQAIIAWFADPEPGLGAHLDIALSELKTLIAESS